MPPAEATSGDLLEMKFGHIRIESFSVDNAAVPDAIEKLNSILKNEQRKRVVFIWRSPADREAITDNAFEDDFDDDDDFGYGEDSSVDEEWAQRRATAKKKEEEYHSQRVTMAESDISLPKLVKRIACIADLDLSVQNGKIWLVDKYAYIDGGVGPPNGMRFYRILPRYAWVFAEPMKFFKDRGVLFVTDLSGEPERVAFDKKDSMLIVMALPETFKRIKKLIEPLLDKSKSKLKSEQESPADAGQ